MFINNWIFIRPYFLLCLEKIRHNNEKPSFPYIITILKIAQNKKLSTSKIFSLNDVIRDWSIRFWLDNGEKYLSVGKASYENLSAWVLNSLKKKCSPQGLNTASLSKILQSKLQNSLQLSPKCIPPSLSCYSRQIKGQWLHLLTPS